MKEVYAIVSDLKVDDGRFSELIIDTEIAPLFASEKSARDFMCKCEDSFLYSIVALRVEG